MIGKTRDTHVEVITLREALTRVHLEGLMPSKFLADNTLVAWTGYPVPFSCGHDSVRGFGPFREHGEGENNGYGSGRMYQEKVRVSNSYCSGAVLFSWCCVDKSLLFYLEKRITISIDHPPDATIDTVLKLCFA